MYFTFHTALYLQMKKYKMKVYILFVCHKDICCATVERVNNRLKLKMKCNETNDL